jgi:hypothetical protein
MIAKAVTTTDSNEETDSSLSDDLKSIQNSIISINRPSSIVLKRYVKYFNFFNEYQNYHLVLLHILLHYHRHQVLMMKMFLGYMKM